MKFAIDNQHYLDKKLLQEDNSAITIPDWQLLLQLRKKQFPKHLFIVLEKDKALFLETVLLSIVKVIYKDDCIHINLDTDLHENDLNIYILQVHQAEQCLFINTSGEHKITVFHENVICQKGKSTLNIKSFGELDYYHLNNSLVPQLSYQEISAVVKGKTQMFFMEKAQASKTKVDLQVELLKEATFNYNFFSILQEKQLRDEAVEIIHKEANSKSTIHYKTLNGGKAVSQINSIVEKNSDNCETHQHIKHVLTHEHAQSYSKPNLMILHPVVATHGNSIGSFSQDNLFYLEQRGLNEQQAKDIISKSMIYHFCEQTAYAKQLTHYFMENINA